MAGAGYSQEYIPNLANYKGLAIVIGMDYSTTPNHEFLPGTEMDVRKMSETFAFLKFAVIKLWNIGKDELISKLSFITQYQIECRRIAVVFSGHGKLGQLYLQDGKTIKTEDLFRLFRHDTSGNISLAKVQLFFIDACRGDAVDHGIYTGKGGDVKSQRIPSTGDLLIAYSTTAHHKAFEHRESGGLWLNLLARELEQSDKAITEILVDVNYKLKSECQRSGIPFQTAECVNYLTENVHLRREALESSSVLDVTQMNRGQYRDQLHQPQYCLTSLPKPPPLASHLPPLQYNASPFYNAMKTYPDSANITTKQGGQQRDNFPTRQKRDIVPLKLQTPPKVHMKSSNDRSTTAATSGVYKQQLQNYCSSTELKYKKKYKYLRSFPAGSLIPLYRTERIKGKHVSSVIIVPLHFGYVTGEKCDSKEEAEESAAKKLLQQF